MITWTREEQKRLAFGAAFLRERMAWASGGDSAEDEGGAVPEWLETWRRNAGGHGGERAFLRRLSLDGLTLREARTILTAEKAPEDEALPDWVTELNEVFASSGEATASPDTSGGFHDALLPFLSYAERRLRSQCGAGRLATFEADAWNDMIQLLSLSLQRVCHKVNAAELRAYASQRDPLQAILGKAMSKDELTKHAKRYHEELLGGGWKALLQQYPVMARRMMMTIESWVRNMAQFAGWVDEDRPDVERTFGAAGGEPLGRIVSVTGQLSDPHNGGQSVLIAKFEAGVKIVLKPRGAAIDAAWRRWVSWLEEEGLPVFRVPDALDRTDHSWTEFIEPLPVHDEREAELFYERAGTLLALVYMLGGEDFHMENLIAHGTHPVLIDTETLLLHRVKPFVLGTSGMSSQQVAHNFLVDSVLRTGMLPVWKSDARGNAVDFSGLTGQDKGASNIPHLGGQPLNVNDYRHALLRGFERTFDFLAARRELLTGDSSPLRLFERCLLRTITRNSQVYGDVLDRVLHPNYLRDGRAYSIEIERMAAAYFLHDGGDDYGDLWNVFVSERNALEEGDIPIYYGYAGERTLRDRTAELHRSFFMETALDRCKAILGQMDVRERKVQTDYIHVSLSMHREPAHGETAATNIAADPSAVVLASDSPDSEGYENGERLKNRFLREAYRLYEEIMDRRIQKTEDDFTWIVLQFDGSTNRMMLGSINISFYDGLIGLGVFLSALYRLTGDERIKHRTLAALTPIRANLYDAWRPMPIHRLTLGLGNGVAGMVRGLSAISRNLGEESLMDDAGHLIRHITSEQIDTDRQLDVFGGSAGMISELVNLHRIRPDDRLLELAVSCGQHLLAKRQQTSTRHRVWDSGLGYAPLTGAAHGMAGFAGALLRLAAVSGDDRYYEAAMEAVDYENALFDAQHRNWPDLRLNGRGEQPGRSVFMTGWCSGAPGIGLARLSSLPYVRERDASVWRTDLDHTVAYAANFPADSGDTLCCGNAGRLDFLLEAASVLERPDLLETARTKACQMLERQTKEGHYRFSGSEGGVVFNPALFHGTSGIGYELLRCIEPAQLPSLLK